MLLLWQVKARDADSGVFGEVFYEISSGNSQSAFIIDPQRTGIIKTTVPLDREIQDVYRQLYIRLLTLTTLLLFVCLYAVSYTHLTLPTKRIV